MAVVPAFIEANDFIVSIATGFTINIGTGSAGQTLVIGFAYEEAQEIATLDIGGNAFSRAVIAKHAGNNTVEIWKGQAPSGPSATLSGTTTGLAIDSGGYAVIRLTGDDGVVADSDGTTNTAVGISLSTVTIPTDGAGIFMWCSDTDAEGAWTNATEVFDFTFTDVDPSGQFSGAFVLTPGTPTVTATGASDDQTIAGVAFGLQSPIFPFRNISEIRFS